ncbi:MAG: BadF/BadG/BcrA/BcrD ATPase family protein [Planctomycetota bacterium]
MRSRKPRRSPTCAFTLCSRALRASNLPAALARRLSRCARAPVPARAAPRAHLDLLEEQLGAERPSVEPFFDGVRLAPALEQVLVAMREAAPALFAPGAASRSDFFRDVATSQYHRFASQLAAPQRLPFEALMSVFDKAILGVESRQVELAFADGAGGRSRVRSRARLDRHDADRLAALLERAFREPLDTVATVGTGYERAAAVPEGADPLRDPVPRPRRALHVPRHRDRASSIGGQDTKAIQVDHSGVVTSFQMNDRCAAALRSLPRLHRRRDEPRLARAQPGCREGDAAGQDQLDLHGSPAPRSATA